MEAASLVGRAAPAAVRPGDFARPAGDAALRGAARSWARRTRRAPGSPGAAEALRALGAPAEPAALTGPEALCALAALDPEGPLRALAPPVVTTTP